MVTRTLNLSDDANEAPKRAAKQRGTSVDVLVSDLAAILDERQQLVDEGRADDAAGRTVDHASVTAWLESWARTTRKTRLRAPIERWSRRALRDIAGIRSRDSNEKRAKAVAARFLEIAAHLEAH